MQPIQTEYNGYKFRSRLEARWAVFFDMLKVRYQYEPEGYVLNDGTKYLPDFYLLDFNTYIEIKPELEIDAHAETKYRNFGLSLEQSLPRKYFCLLSDIPLFDIAYDKWWQHARFFNGILYREYDITDSINRSGHSQKQEFAGAWWQQMCRLCGENYLHIDEVNAIAGEYHGRLASSIKYHCEYGCSYTEVTTNYKGELFRFVENARRKIDNIFVNLANYNQYNLQDALHAARTARFEHGEVPLSMQIPSIRNATLQNLQRKP